mgnify:CR=1 FL=1
MNAQQRDALRDKVEGTTSAFVDASVATLEAELMVALKYVQDYAEKQAQAIEALETKLAAVEKDTIKSVDDRYSLTKAKMIRMMKDMGYYK